MINHLVLSWIIPLVFSLIGIGLLILAIHHFKRTKSFAARAKETTGKVIALEEVPPTTTGESCTYRPEVSFQTEGDQRQIRFKTLSHSNPPRYKIGDSVQVFYLADNPHEARIHSFIDFWLLSLIFGTLGGVFLFIGLALLFNIIP